MVPADVDSQLRAPGGCQPSGVAALCDWFAGALAATPARPRPAPGESAAPGGGLGRDELDEAVANARGTLGIVQELRQVG